MEVVYQGFHENSELPIKRGQELTIPKGTLYHHRGELHETRRAYKVRVHSVLNGMSVCVGHIYKDGHVNLNFMSRNDRETVEELYGTSDLSQLWPRMTVRNNSIYLPVSNPMVTWAGSGGYWSDADINQFLSE